MFEVVNANATAKVAAMSDWCVGNIQQDQFCCAAECGACGDTCDSLGRLSGKGAAGSCCTPYIQSPCLTESQHTCVSPWHASMQPLHFH